MQSLLDGFREDYDKLLRFFLPSATAAGGLKGTDADGLEHTSPAGPSSAQLMNTGAAAAAAAAAPTQIPITFNAFVHCFKGLRFGAILCGHRSDNSLREFFELVTRFLLERIVETYEVEVRITSFYLLYALWFVQSKLNQASPLQIRVNRELFTHVQSLVKHAQVSRHLDLVIAYRRLIRANAFAFVESLDHLGPFYKTYLARRTLTMPVDSSDRQKTAEELELQADVDNYIDTLKELHLELYCDMLECDLDVF